MSARRRARIVGGLAAVALSAACATTALSARAPAAQSTWAAVSTGLRPALDPASSNPCQRGDPRCLDILLGEMVRRAGQLVAACDHGAMFAVTYEKMTAAIRAAARAGRFQDRALMSLFTALFARMYTQAFDAWRAGRRGAVPSAWQAAFGAADHREVNGLGDLLLGMNAHITHDLPYVVAAVMRQPGTRVNPDYAQVTGIIGQVSQAALRDLGDHLDPSLSLARVPIVLGAQPSFGALISLWRTESWQNGIALRDATPANRGVVAARIGRTADLRTALIEGATSYLPLIEDSTSRDAYCAAHHGTWSP